MKISAPRSAMKLSVYCVTFVIVLVGCGALDSTVSTDSPSTETSTISGSSSIASTTSATQYSSFANDPSSTTTLANGRSTDDPSSMTINGSSNQDSSSTAASTASSSSTTQALQTTTHKFTVPSCTTSPLGALVGVLSTSGNVTCQTSIPDVTAIFFCGSAGCRNHTTGRTANPANNSIIIMFNFTSGCTKGQQYQVYVEWSGQNISAGIFSCLDISVNLSRPMDTIVEGGTKLLIAGSGFNVSAQLRQPVDLQFKVSVLATNPELMGECSVINDTLLECLTPNLVNSVQIDINTTQLGSKLATYDLSVTVDKYFDIRSEKSQLTVYHHPHLEPLSHLQPFIPTDNPCITIQGTNLVGHGFTVNDVSVTAGTAETMPHRDNVCRDVTLTATTITCRPPALPIDMIRYQPSSGINPAQPNITVWIGNYKFAANQIQYTLGEPFNVIMSVMIAILLFIIFISVLFAILATCHCGDNYNAVKQRAVPYEPMNELNDDANNDTTRHPRTKAAGFNGKHDGGDTIECKAIRYKNSDMLGVINEGYSQGKSNDSSFETLSL